MMKRYPTFLIVAVFFLYVGSIQTVNAASPTKEGDIHTGHASDAEDTDKKKLSIILSHRILPAGFLRFEADLDVVSEDLSASTEEVLAPQVYVALGSSIYAGLGAGILFSNGAFADKAFYSLKAGFDLELLPMIYLNLNANYRFDEWNLNGIMEDIDTEAVSLGGKLRLQF